jgi:hypothetical protein
MMSANSAFVAIGFGSVGDIDAGRKVRHPAGRSRERSRFTAVSAFAPKMHVTVGLELVGMTIDTGFGKLLIHNALPLTSGC